MRKDKKRTVGAAYYEDKSFVCIGMGVLGVLTRYLYVGATLFGKALVIFSLCSWALGLYYFIKARTYKRIEKNCPMTVPFALYEIERYIEQHAKKTDESTVQHIKALQCVCKCLEEKGYKSEPPTEYASIYETVKKDVLAKNNIDVDREDVDREDVDSLESEICKEIEEEKSE